MTWIKTNYLSKKDFSSEKTLWKKETEQEPNFFSDTELLFLYFDILILKVLDSQQATFLAQTYQLERQSICQKLFLENKHIILLSQRQWSKYFQLENSVQNQLETEKAIVLLKDEASIEKSFANWLTKKK
ncbi:MAG: hypothetical protein MRERC_16c014 [Mycoplasmataceae bacterium RC_NB112A]|nr:MAG: hypothetical protein MRERC_16c014 [Mycoplasmataceae bacterium RC_NB112A]